MATHSHIPAWRIPWTEELGKLQTRGPICYYFCVRSQDVALDQALKVLETNLSTQATSCTHMECLRSSGKSPYNPVKGESRADLWSSSKETTLECQASVSKYLCFSFITCQNPAPPLPTPQPCLTLYNTAFLAPCLTYPVKSGYSFPCPLPPNFCFSVFLF